MEVPELPRYMWLEIMKLRHEMAVEEMMPRWFAQHKKRTEGLRRELLEVTFDLQDCDAKHGIDRVYLRQKSFNCKIGTVYMWWVYVPSSDYLSHRVAVDKGFQKHVQHHKKQRLVNFGLGAILGQSQVIVLAYF
jgi:hypothetical protein